MLHRRSPTPGLTILVLVGAIAALTEIGLFSFAWAMVALLWALVLATAAMVVYLVVWYARNRLAPVVRVRARVVRRWFKPWDISISGETTETAAARLGMLGRDPEAAKKAYIRSLKSPGTPELHIAGGNDYFVTFAFEGREEEFMVPEDAYENAPEGAEGLLVFQGVVFRGFHRKVGG